MMDENYELTYIQNVKVYDYKKIDILIVISYYESCLENVE